VELLSAKDKAGGILVGVKSDVFEVVSWDIHSFCVMSLVGISVIKVCGDFFYGSAYDEFKLNFINKLHNVLGLWDGPTLIGGDFNLINECKEKNTSNINQHWANLFNDWINKFESIELKNAGRKFTWANNQDNLIMVAIDRIFMTICWENMFPVVSLRALARVRSDHTPQVFDIGAFSTQGQTI
jgi:hypothetical protein